MSATRARPTGRSRRSIGSADMNVATSRCAMAAHAGAADGGGWAAEGPRGGPRWRLLGHETGCERGSGSSNDDIGGGFSHAAP